MADQKQTALEALRELLQVTGIVLDITAVNLVQAAQLNRAVAEAISGSTECYDIINVELGEEKHTIDVTHRYEGKDVPTNIPLAELHAILRGDKPVIEE